jgi:hypothetical protein
MAIKINSMGEKPRHANVPPGTPPGRAVSISNLIPYPKGHVQPESQRETVRRFKSIKSFLVNMHDEEATGEILTAFRHYWPSIKGMTMREAWLRIVYMEAIAGQPWASMFIADRSEGKVGEGGLANDKGTILNSIEQMLDNPITEEAE